jgi:hypothetical protein
MSSMIPHEGLDSIEPNTPELDATTPELELDAPAVKYLDPRLIGYQDGNLSGFDDWANYI